MHIVLQGRFPRPPQARVAVAVAVVLWLLVARNDLRVYQRPGRGKYGTNPTRLGLLPLAPAVVLLWSVYLER